MSIEGEELSEVVSTKLYCDPQLRCKELKREGVTS